MVANFRSVSGVRRLGLGKIGHYHFIDSPPDMITDAASICTYEVYGVSLNKLQFTMFG